MPIGNISNNKTNATKIELSKSCMLLDKNFAFMINNNSMQIPYLKISFKIIFYFLKTVITK